MGGSPVSGRDADHIGVAVTEKKRRLKTAGSKFLLLPAWFWAGSLTDGSSAAGADGFDPVAANG